MSFIAFLNLDGKEFGLREYRCTTSQAVNDSGVPISGVVSGDFEIILDGIEDDTFIHWMFDYQKKFDGEFVFKDLEGNTKRKVEFKEAYGVKLVESFISGNKEEIKRVAFNEYLQKSDPKTKQDVFDIQSTRSYNHIMENHVNKGRNYITLFDFSARKVSFEGVEHENTW